MDSLRSGPRRGGGAGRASLVPVDSETSAVRAFLSHASEDKSGFVEPLARELAEMGVAPWLDIWEIRPGDSLLGSGERGQVGLGGAAEGHVLAGPGDATDCSHDVGDYQR
jgi:hypothetical protein